ncbi:MAG: cell division protein FtsZ, partial [Pseudomonadota bacterium]
MNIKLDIPKIADLRPRIAVIGIGGAGCNAINNMIATGLEGVEFVAANTDAQALAMSSAEHQLQLGAELAEGLGAGARPEVGRGAAEEAIDEIRSQIEGCHMVFLAAGMGGGTGTGAISVVARVAREMDILTVAIVSKPFQFEGSRRMRTAEEGIKELSEHVDTLIVIPNQNLFRIANPKTTFAEAFVLADQVLYSGIACIVDLIVKDGLINLDFADVKAVMKGMGSAMMGTGEATGEDRATLAAEKAIANPLLDEISLTGARGLLISIIGDQNLTLFEVDEAASRVKSEAHPDANIIVGASFEDDMDNKIRVSIVAAGFDGVNQYYPNQDNGHHVQQVGSQPSMQTAPEQYSEHDHATAQRPMDHGNHAAAHHPPASQPPPGTAESEAVGDHSAPQLDQESEESTRAIASALAPRVATDNQHPAARETPPPTGAAPLAPPPLPATAPANVDPYLGDTPAEEFARALEDVIKSVASDNGEDDSLLDHSWVSPDGV